ncbi:MAG: PQQ-dependent sugar dehydrogenase, partial [Deltaproteobacteria bacterium]|nr:PQQ-dependent sugar dehydrogenase [Deltaproteobacteria bacterium]
MMSIRKTLFLGLILSLTLAQTGKKAEAQGAFPFPAISLSLKFAGLTNPVQITHAGDGSNRLFIVEQPGRIRIVENGVLLSTPFLDIGSTGANRVLSGGEQGLLGIAFPPGFAQKNYFYVNYTRIPDGATVVARYFVTANPNLANPAIEEVILTIPQPFANHNGGQLAFSPVDGFLYIGMGDGGSGCDPFNNGQTPGTLLGKMLRIDVEAGIAPYAVPSTNPFVNTPGFLPEIWALGLRNPFRFSFDRLTGNLFIGDVGQNAFEEIDFQPFTSAGGENYGWNVMEGFHFSFDLSGCSPPCLQTSSCNQAGLSLPVVEYDHGQGCSVIGGFVYRGNLHPRMQGIYFYGDFCTGRIWGLRLSGPVWENSLLFTAPFTISSFGEDEAGELYLTDYVAGDIYQITVPATKDFDGDGKADILWRHTGGAVAFWLMDGLTITAVGIPAVVGNDWQINGIGDLNGDGRADILWRHTAGAVAIWLMNGLTVAAVGVPAVIGNDWQINGVGDLNGDGRADILWRHTAGAVAIWLMNGLTITAVGVPAVIGNDWQINGVGDFNGDGRADIFWRHTGGAVALWLMNGLTITTVGIPEVVGNDWQING